MSGQGIHNLTPSYRAVFYCSTKGVAHFVITREDSDSVSYIHSNHEMYGHLNFTLELA